MRIIFDAAITYLEKIFEAKSILPVVDKKITYSEK